MNILFLADNFPPERNAQALRVFERARYWVEWGHATSVLTCAPNFPEGRVYPGYKNRWRQQEWMANIRVVRVKTLIAANQGTVIRILDFLSYMVSAFFVGIFQPRPDVVAATSPQFFAAVAALAIARVKRVPFVMEVADLWPQAVVAVGAMKQSFGLRMVEKLELYMYRKATAIVALTPAFKASLVARGVPESKVTVVLNGVDLSRLRPQPRSAQLAAELGIEEGDFVVAYLGTLGMAHGLGNVLDCAAMVDDPRIRFLFVGPGAERERLVEAASRRGLRNVIFVPPQPRERMPEFWSISDVALVHLRDTPMLHNVIPSKIFEAMGMGRPILLAAPEGEASSIIVRENAGLWVRSGDARALADAVSLLKNNAQLMRRLAEASAAAAPRYTRERQAREVLQCLSRAADRGVKAEVCVSGG